MREWRQRVTITYLHIPDGLPLGEGVKVSAGLDTVEEKKFSIYQENPGVSTRSPSLHRLI
jgi:hypothetical protein